MPLLAIIGFVLQIVITVAITLLVLFCAALLFRDGRHTLHKFYHLTKTFIGVDVGMGGLIRLALYSAVPALAVAFNKGLGKDIFDWTLFWEVFLVITIIGVITNLLNSSLTFKDLLSPGSGHVWRNDRKAATAAIIKKLSANIGKADLPVTEVRSLLTDLLDIVALHVRDHRGSHSKDKHEVFANILLEDGEKLTVVARDSILHKMEYERKIPLSYSKSTMLCGRSLESRKALSVGDLTHAYPEGPKNKPYRSILAIPLFGTDDTPYGVLSIDSSRPYFFESFITDQVENDLENSLQPYLQLITMILECLVSHDKSVVLQKLTQEVDLALQERESNDTQPKLNE